MGLMRPDQDSVTRTAIFVVGVPSSDLSRLARALAFARAPDPRSDDTADDVALRIGALAAAHLRDMGDAPHDWARLDPAAVPATTAGAFTAALRAVAARHWPDNQPDHSPALICDPATGRLLRPVAAALAAEGIASRAVIALPHPLEVAQELHDRDGLDLQDALLVWLRRLTDAEHDSRDLPRSIVPQTRLLADWRGTLDRIGADLGIAWPRLSAQTPGPAPEAPGGFAHDDRRHRWTAADLATIPACRGLVQDVHAALALLADTPADTAAMAALDDARARLDDIEALTRGQRQTLLAEIADLRARITEAGAGQQRLADSAMALAQHKDDLRDTVGFVMEINRKLQKQAGDLRIRLTLAETALANLGRRQQAWLDAEVSLKTLRQQLDQERARFQAEIMHKHADIMHQQADIDHMVRTLNEVYASRSWQLSAPLRAATIAARKVRSAARDLTRTLARGGSREEAPGVAEDQAALAIPGPDPEDSNSDAIQTPDTAPDTDTGPDTGPDSQPPLPVVPDSTSHFRPRRVLAPLQAPKARLIAFYLPQFHPIPENDAWWGEGFTEWTNVRPAQPMFPGHYQPHEPGELGYYDLRDTDVQRRQIALAQLYGLGGFCFYWYWFGGKRLLEKPVTQWLETPDLDFPFCICWANENWTRRWDGAESEILIGQSHSTEDDLAFIAELGPYLRDPRYIRIDGKPLVIVYRPALLPDAAATAETWRTWCRDAGIGEIHLAYVQSFERTDPVTYGFDAAIEFPPNGMGPRVITDRIEGRDPDFTGIVHDWQSYVDRSRDYPAVSYQLFPGVMPGWDNTARRKKNGTIFLNNRPDDYGVWLSNAVTRTTREAISPDHRIVFCNAWNEWAEGAHLEPDLRFGHAFLEATRDALDPAMRPRHITLVGHDAHHHGAQLLLLNLARAYRAAGLQVTILLLKEGMLVDQYRAVARVEILPDPVLQRDAALALLRCLRHEDGEVAIANTSVTGLAVPLLREAGYRVVSLVHEMASVHAQMKLLMPMLALAGAAHAVVFPARIVQDQFEATTGITLGQAVTRPQGLYLQVGAPATTANPAGPPENPPENPADTLPDIRLPDIRTRTRTDLGIAPGTPVLMGSGFIDHRKGVDLFVQSLAALRARGVPAVGIWIGHASEGQLAHITRLSEDLDVADALLLLGRQSDPARFYAAADVFLLTSREDPYPSVVIEAMAARVPVVMFRDSTGCEDLARRGCALAVAKEDPAAMAAAVADLLSDAPGRAAMVTRAADVIARESDFTDYAFDLLAIAGRPLPRISVVIPNYNYAGYIAARIGSVLDQDMPVFEIIVLDDCSTDDSLAVIAETVRDCPVPVRVVPNERNSGNVFRQWQKGLALARGDHVWIAEADDLAEPDFLSTVMRGFEVEGVVMSYCDSAQIDGAGTRTAPDYRYYTDPVCPGKWDDNHIARGTDEIATALFLKNTIPNVSAVVMRRDVALQVFADHAAEIEALSFAGDWAFYVRMLERGDLAYLAPSRNLHRRHASSVTIANFNRRQLDEIAAVQAATIARHGLGEDHRARAAAYIAELARQFGLAQDSRQTLHPA